MAEYVLCRTLGDREAVYTIHAAKYRCHVGERVATVSAPDIDGAVNQLGAWFGKFMPTFKECPCVRQAALGETW